jgi:hypothetical protein
MKSENLLLMWSRAAARGGERDASASYGRLRTGEEVFCGKTPL